MSEAPRRPGLRTGRAAGRESGPEPRFNTRLAPKSQYPVQLRRQRHCQQISRTPRLVFELFDQVARHYTEIAADLDRRLAAYARLDAMVLQAIGGNKFAPLPLHVIDGGR